ncbi:hypothetical protein DsansV1_C16g0138921 [Dioscorea sansibarensis]
MFSLRRSLLLQSVTWSASSCDRDSVLILMAWRRMVVSWSW